MGRFSKLIGAIAGNAVGILLVWLAMKVPALAECKVVAGVDAEACTLLGFTQTEVTGAVLAVLNSAFVYFFPANKPPA
jgi:hypothetical protein